MSGPAWVLTYRTWVFVGGVVVVVDGSGTPAPIGLDTLADSPALSVTVSVTIYRPWGKKSCVTDTPVFDWPSPKSQTKLTSVRPGAGVDPNELKLTTSRAAGVSGEKMKSALVLGGIVEVVVDVVVEVLWVSLTTPGPRGVSDSHAMPVATRSTVSASLRMSLHSHIAPRLGPWR
jgi:hypothetical protein